MTSFVTQQDLVFLADRGRAFRFHQKRSNRMRGAKVRDD